MTDIDTIQLLLPEIILIAAATVIFVAGAFWRLKAAASWAAIGALIMAGAMLFTGDHQRFGFDDAMNASLSGPLVVDLFGYTARWGILAVGFLLVLMTARAQDYEQRSEEAASLLLLLAGLMLIAAGNELILLFVGLELVSIPTYVILYLGRHDARGQEAVLKYFFLSILSSAVLLYGFSFLYGAAGSTRLGQIAQAIGHPVESAAASSALIPLAILLVFAGLAFRLTAVPFHFYAPDVYQGTSNANAGLLATLPKIAGLVVLARILVTALPGWESLGWKVMFVVSVLTMTLGNVLALWQNNIRRMLAYSSIAHAGYLLIGFSVVLAARTVPATAGGTGQAIDGLGAAVFYLAVYMLATLGTFAALMYLRPSEAKQIDTLDDLAGLNRTHPLVAIMLAVFMFSLTGIPPLAGFWGKFALLFGALTLDDVPAQGGLSLRHWFIGLSVIAVLNAAIGAAYYLRVIGVMYFRAPELAAPRAQRGAGPALALATCAALVIGIGVWPTTLFDVANRAGRSVRQPPAEQAARGVSPASNPIVAARHSP